MEKQAMAGSPQGWDRGALSPGAEAGVLLGHPLAAAGADDRAWRVDGHFDAGGPWAGVRDILARPVEETLASRPDRAHQHSYELAYVFPELRERLDIRNLTLTELAPRGEKVRNYPADRAYRVINGLIDFLTAWNEGSSTPWQIEVENAHQLGTIGRRFFQELLRRRGETLDLRLVLHGPGDRIAALLDGFDERQRERVEVRPSLRSVPSEPDPEVGREAALRLEAEVGEDPVAIEERLPELLRLWTAAGDEERIFRWRLWGLDIYNNLGLYHDARRYGEPALEMSRALDVSTGNRWALFTKLLMSRVGTQDGEDALALAQGWPYEMIDDPLRRAQYCYLMAMLYARHLQKRDFGKAEEYLDQGLECIHEARLPDEDHHFHIVFNRNGLALIRHFQGKAEEAIELCRVGFEQLQEHLSLERHKLHRSVLLYNQAQVYAVLGMTDEAIRHFDEAIAMDPNFSEYHNERANALLKDGRLSEALGSYRRAIELSPPYPEVFGNLGQCCQMLGRTEEALEAFSVALDLDPQQAFSHLGRGELREETGDEEGALRDYSEAIALRPQHWRAYARRGVLLYGRGDLAGAEADLRRAVEAGGPALELHFNHGVVLSDLGRAEEACGAFERYIELDPPAEDRAEAEQRIADLRERVRGAGK